MIRDSFVAPGAHVLVVDDDETNRKIFARILEKTQIDITQADSGQYAIGLASCLQYDIIFMDHMMPGMDGVVAMKTIREKKNGPNASTPVIALTANVVEGAEEMYRREGFDGFIAKPIEASRLKKVLRDFLPEKYIIPVEEEVQTETVKTTEVGFPMIFGVDWDVAMMRLKDRETIDEILGDFVNTVDPQTAELEDYKDRFPDKLDDYRILVHATKNVAASLGIFTVSGMAAVLEKAASEEDFNTIYRIHDVFIDEWRSCKDSLYEYLHADDPEEDEKEELTEKMLEALLYMLESAMEDMDIDVADVTIKKMSSFRLPEYVAVEFDELKSAVSRLDRDMVMEILQRIKEGKPC